MHLKIGVEFFLMKRFFPFKVKYFFLFVMLAAAIWTFSLTCYNGVSIIKLKKSFQDIKVMQFLENFYSSFNESLNISVAGNKISTKKTLKKIGPVKIDCEPIVKSIKQYSVLIDGIRYPTQTPLHKNFSINFQCLDKNPNKKTILFYNTWFGNEEFSIGIGYRTPFIRSGCPVTSCEATNDKKRLNESDFVVTHMADSIPGLPVFRPTNQRWIFFLDVTILCYLNS